MDPVFNSLPADVQAYIAKKFGGRKISVQPLPIWSTVRFQATIAAGPPVTATIDTSARTAFSYGLNTDMASAGRSGVLATAADTSLLNSNQTNQNADVFIWGLAAYVAQNSEPLLAADLMREVSIDISTNPNVTLPLGTLEMFPAGGGLYGAGRSALLQPGLDTPGGVDGGAGVALGMFGNGNPMSGSFYRLPQPMLWQGVGGGGSDSSLAITCTPRRSIVRTSALARAAAAGISAFTPITATQAFVDIRWRLVCVSVSLQSTNGN